MKAEVKEVPLITVKAINEKIVEQLYPGRGELNSDPYPDIGPEWLALAKLSTTGDVLIRNMSNGEIRLCWAWRYAATKQEIKDHMKLREFQATIVAALPTVYVA
jgi:hypothetical protein